MNVGSTVFQSLVLTILWIGFAYASSEFKDGKPPKAIEVPSESVELDHEGEKKELTESLAQLIIENQGSSFMAKERLEQATEAYVRNRWLLAGLSVLLGIGTFVLGLKLFGHWGYAVAALVFGPAIVAYYFLYKANLSTPPSPKMPS